LLTHFGTLPLSGQAETLVSQSGQLPQWKSTVGYSKLLRLQPVDADWMVISPVLEDAGWQLLRAGIPVGQVPSLLSELDSLISELSERYP
jgi:hypothetical protein